VSVPTLPAPSDRHAALAGLVETTRELMLAAGTTDLQPDRIREAERLLAEATRILGERRRPRINRPAFGAGWADQSRDEPIHLAPYNPLCIPLAVIIEGSRASAVLTPEALHEGPPDHFHGGFSAAILDQVLGYLVFAQGTPAVTARLDLVYLKGIRLDEPIEVVGEITSVAGRKIHADGWITQYGERAIEARGLFMRPRLSAPAGQDEESRP